MDYNGKVTRHGREGFWLRRLARAQPRAVGMGLVEGVERVTAGDEPQAGPGRAVAEGAADRLALERDAAQHVGRQVRVCEHHPAEADEIGEALAHVALG